MLNRSVPCLVLTVLLLPVAVFAQGPAAPAPPAVESPAAAPGSGDVRLELRSPRHVLLPRPSMETVVRDAEEVREAVEAERRREEILREARERPVLRPDLDPSVMGAIQTREINRLLLR